VKDMRKNWNNGFTLAELLVVVAIIVVLVAVSIPIFTGKVEKARAAACLSNKTALYHEIAADLISGDITYDQIDDALLATYVAKQEAKCPSDGTYSISKDTENETFKVVCSYHDNGSTETLIGMASETNRRTAFGYGTTGGFLAVLKEIMKNSQLTASQKTIVTGYDSTATSERVPYIERYLKTYKIDYAYWSLKSSNGKNTSEDWKFYFTNKDIDKNASTVNLIQYDTKTDTFTVGSAKTEDYNLYDENKKYLGTYKRSKPETYSASKTNLTYAQALAELNKNNGTN